MIKPLLKLPILEKHNKSKYPKWHAYYENVYKSPVINPVDLNKFNWFYWNSPLGNVKCKILYSLGNIVDENVPYIFKVLWPEKQGIGVAPENNLANIGFFVKRNIKISRTNFLEVMRTNKSIFEERGVCWFFNTIGSGFFLKCDKSFIGSRNEIKEGWDREAEKNPFKILKNRNINTFIINKEHPFSRQGLIEIVFRLKKKNVIANTANLPLFRGGIPYKHKYHPKTHCMY